MRKDKKKIIGWCNTAIGRHCNKRIEFKFMKERKPGFYSSMSEMVAELNAKISAKPKTISLHSDGFDIRFESDLAMRMGFKKNEAKSKCGSNQ